MSKLDEDLERAFTRFIPAVNEQILQEQLERRRGHRAARRRVGVGVLAIVVVVASIAMAAGLQVAFRTHPRPAGQPLPVATRFVLPNRPLSAVPFDGSLWTLTKRSFLQVDISTGSVTREIPVGRPGGDVLAAAGSVWVTSQAHGTLLRIDPTTGGVVSTFQLETRGAFSRFMALAGNDEAIWVSSSNGLTKIDPSTNRIVQHVELHRSGGDITIEGNNVWMAEGAEGLMRIDPASGQTEQHRVPLTRGRQVVIMSVIAENGSVVGIGEDVRLRPSGGGRMAYDYLPGSTIVHIDTRSGAQRTHRTIGLSFVEGPGGAFVLGLGRTLARVDIGTGEVSNPIRIAQGLAFAVSGSTVWVTEGRNGVVHAVDASTAPTVAAVYPTSNAKPGNDLGPLGCAAPLQFARLTQIPLVPGVPAETSDQAVRRTFRGLLAGDDVIHYASSEAGEYVKILRGGEVIERVFVSRGGDGWYTREIAGCDGTGVHPPR